MSEKVSIIVPVYNVEKYIDECIISLLNQTYENLEIILVDDGSTDSSGERCNKFADSDTRIKVIHQKNGGAGSAKNSALRTVSGEYVAFVDSDDYVLPKYIQTLLETVRNTDADIAECGFINLRKSQQTAVDNSPVGIFSAESFLLRFLNDWKCSLLCNKLFRRELLYDLFFYEGRVIDDEFFTYKAVMRAGSVAVINDPLYIYRQRKTSVTNQGRWKQRLKDRLAYFTERYNLVTAAFPQLKPQYLYNLTDNLIRIKRESNEFPDLTAEVSQAMKMYVMSVLFGPINMKMKYSYVKNLYKQARESWHAQEAPDWEDFFD